MQKLFDETVDIYYGKHGSELSKFNNSNSF